MSEKSSTKSGEATPLSELMVKAEQMKSIKLAEHVQSMELKPGVMLTTDHQNEEKPQPKKTISKPQSSVIPPKTLEEDIKAAIMVVMKRHNMGATDFRRVQQALRIVSNTAIGKSGWFTHKMRAAGLIP